MRACGYKLLDAVVADTLAGFFTEKGKAAACSATEAALTIARGFDERSGPACYGAGLVVDVAIAAEIAGVVEYDFFGLRRIGRRG